MQPLSNEDVKIALSVAAQNWGLPASAVNELAANPQVTELLTNIRKGLSTSYMGTDQTGGLYWAGPEELGKNLIYHNNTIGLFNQATGGKYSDLFSAADARATQFKEANKVGGLLAGEIPWQAAVMLGIMGAGAGGLLGAAGAPGGAAGGGAVGAGLEGAASAYSAAGAAGAGAADMSAGWGVTQGGGMDADLLALLDSPAGGGGSMGDWWSQALGTGSNYSASDLASILGVGGGSSGSSWLDYLRQGSSAVNSVSGLFKDNPLLGAALGGLAGSLNGSKQAGTTTVTNEPWAAQQPYLLAGFQGALNTLGQTAPSNTLGPANQGLLSTIRGDYLNANPYLDATYQRAAAQVLPGVEGYFSRAGRTGSNSAANALGDTSVKLATDIYGQNYARERGLQNSAILNAPSFSQGMTAAMYAPISQYMSTIGANRGTSMSTPYYDNPLGSILSGALAGYNLSRP